MFPRQSYFHGFVLPVRVEGVQRIEVAICIFARVELVTAKIESRVKVKAAIAVGIHGSRRDVIEHCRLRDRIHRSRRNNASVLIDYCTYDPSERLLAR